MNTGGEIVRLCRLSQNSGLLPKTGGLTGDV
jgi:hypothetical protein